MTNGDGPDDSDPIRILSEERIRLQLEQERTRHELSQESQDRALRRWRERIESVAAIVVVCVALPYLGYVALYGTASHQVWATHLIAVIVGIAAGALWRGHGKSS